VLLTLWTSEFPSTNLVSQILKEGKGTQGNQGFTMKNLAMNKRLLPIWLATMLLFFILASTALENSHAALSTNGLVGYWKLDENSGSIGSDRGYVWQ
jgi:hypothetical protein